MKTRNNQWEPKPQTYDTKFILEEMKAIDNYNLNIWAKLFKDNEEIKQAIIKEYEIRLIA